MQFDVLWRYILDKPNPVARQKEKVSVVPHLMRHNGENDYITFSATANLQGCCPVGRQMYELSAHVAQPLFFYGLDVRSHGAMEKEFGGHCFVRLYIHIDAVPLACTYALMVVRELETLFVACRNDVIQFFFCKAVVFDEVLHCSPSMFVKRIACVVSQ